MQKGSGYEVDEEMDRGQIGMCALALIFLNIFEFENANLIDLGLSRRIYAFQKYFDIEIQGQIAKYFGDHDNWEFSEGNK